LTRGRNWKASTARKAVDEGKASTVGKAIDEGTTTRKAIDEGTKLEVFDRPKSRRRGEGFDRRKSH
jgi:hypothetical protein